MTRRNFRLSFAWADATHEDRRLAQLMRRADSDGHGGWCHKCGEWAPGAKRGDYCPGDGCEGTIDITGGGDD